jgi:hypothetical protein
MKVVIIKDEKQYNISVDDLLIGDISLGDLVKKVGKLESEVKRIEEDYKARESRLAKKWEKLK